MIRRIKIKPTLVLLTEEDEKKGYLSQATIKIDLTDKLSIITDENGGVYEIDPIDINAPKKAKIWIYEKYVSKENINKVIPFNIVLTSLIVSNEGIVHLKVCENTDKTFCLKNVVKKKN